MADATATSPLIQPEQLSDFPGAPFAQGLVAAACADVRGACGWHIAPTIDETFSLDVDEPFLDIVLPSRKLIEVLEIRRIRQGQADEVLTDCTVNLRLGILTRGRRSWPLGASVLEIDVRHGHAECPADLLPLIAGRAQVYRTNPTLASETLGAYSASFRDGLNPQAKATLLRHSTNIGVA